MRPSLLLIATTPAANAALAPALLGAALRTPALPPASTRCPRRAEAEPLERHALDVADAHLQRRIALLLDASAVAQCVLVDADGDERVAHRDGIDRLLPASPSLHHRLVLEVGYGSVGAAADLPARVLDDGADAVRRRLRDLAGMRVRRVVAQVADDDAARLAVLARASLGCALVHGSIGFALQVVAYRRVRGWLPFAPPPPATREPGVTV